ncbi:MAG TPA: DEAD/DEAH box helicase, partial [Pirellulaceae bacterium]|nr:DEAD/DEAH box helicase [Pirellulaceae bacterium]
PYPYQERLALSDELPSLVAVPTGVGKTAAAVLAWLYRRRFAAESVRAATPRRLIYCLPMRTLVEQTASCVRRWLERLELNGEVGVELLLGGSEVGDWERTPERDCVLIGTQDMLLSRALNRGYGMSRYRWPVDFGLLNNDSLWVIDETQLFGAGLPTTAQLAGLRSKLGAYGANHTLWMSATLDAKQLDTVDHPLSSVNRRLELNDDDRGAPEVERLLTAPKPLRKHDLVLNSTTDKQYAAKMAAAVLELHQAESITLVVVNRVLRARQIGGELGKLLHKKAASAPEVRIVHSRFRPADRQREQAAALDSSTLSAAGRIIVATQAIEAGVDISARTLITELAPWASMVQRFGRCNRRGEFSADSAPAQVVWVDCDETNDKFALPYSARDLT